MADLRLRELLLLEGISLQGLGNWQAISEHVGTRTKEEVEKHYHAVYIESPNWPLPVRLTLPLPPSPPLTLTYSSPSLREWMSNSTSIQPNFRSASGGEYHL